MGMDYCQFKYLFPAFLQLTGESKDWVDFARMPMVYCISQHNGAPFKIGRCTDDLERRMQSYQGAFVRFYVHWVLFVPEDSPAAEQHFKYALYQQRLPLPVFDFSTFQCESETSKLSEWYSVPLHIIKDQAEDVVDPERRERVDRRQVTRKHKKSRYRASTVLLAGAWQCGPDRIVKWNIDGMQPENAAKARAAWQKKARDKQAGVADSAPAESQPSLSSASSSAASSALAGVSVGLTVADLQKNKKTRTKQTNDLATALRRSRNAQFNSHTGTLVLRNTPAAVVNDDRHSEQRAGAWMRRWGDWEAERWGGMIYDERNRLEDERGEEASVQDALSQMDAPSEPASVRAVPPVPAFNLAPPPRPVRASAAPSPAPSTARAERAQRRAARQKAAADAKKAEADAKKAEAAAGAASIAHRAARRARGFRKYAAAQLYLSYNSEEDES